MEQTYYSHGKLLLTGEYLVLDGATALAIPTKKGQSMSVVEQQEGALHWTSFDEGGTIWFEANFDLPLRVTQTSHDGIANTLASILDAAKRLNPKFLSGDNGYAVTTTLEFPRNWGLGTSSTLINNIAQWANVDAFQLLENSFGGSGYDIAAAQNERPIFYTKRTPSPEVKPITLAWDFTDSLFFVHLNAKQDSKQGIAHYQKQTVTERDLQRITDISRKLLLCYTLDDFVKLMESHERLIAEIIQLPTVKERLFPDYAGVLKSLGAWGGDFILASGGTAQQGYFRSKGYTTLIPFSEMIA